MIGNTIIFKDRIGTVEMEREALVVDAFTDVYGSASGENFLGFGDMRGRISSMRKYKVQITFKHTGAVIFQDINDYQVERIVKFADKIITKENEFLTP